MTKNRGHVNHGTEVLTVLLNMMVATVGKNICLHVCCEVKKLMLRKMWKNKCNLNHVKEVHKVILNVYGVSIYT